MNWIRYQIELPGIIGSVKSVCDDPYIIGYVNKLAMSIKMNDHELTNILSNRIYEWYQKNMEKLMKNQFVYNKENQVYTMNILEELINDTTPLNGSV